MSALTDLVSKCCKKEVTKDEYNDFLDPLVSKVSAQKLQSKKRSYVFYYNFEEEIVVAVAITEMGEVRYWLTE